VRGRGGDQQPSCARRDDAANYVRFEQRVLRRPSEARSDYDLLLSLSLSLSDGLLDGGVLELADDLSGLDELDDAPADGLDDGLD
jgi:hypothetical protein